MQAGHLYALPLYTIYHLHKLWLSPLAVIPQWNRRPLMIYDFTRSSLNATTARLAPQGAMRLGKTLYCTLKRIINTNPALCSVYLSKVDLTPTCRFGFERRTSHQ